MQQDITEIHEKMRAKSASINGMSEAQVMCVWQVLERTSTVLALTATPISLYLSPFTFLFPFPLYKQRAEPWVKEI